MTIEIQEPETAEAETLATWGEELLPLELHCERDRCDACGVQAHHAWVVDLVVILMCNHHGRENRARLLPYAHRDYRMPLAEAERINREGRDAALAENAKPVATSHTVDPITRAGMKVNDEYQEVPRHLTQWDAAFWNRGEETH